MAKSLLTTGAMIAPIDSNEKLPLSEDVLLDFRAATKLAATDLVSARILFEVPSLFESIESGSDHSLAKQMREIYADNVSESEYDAIRQLGLKSSEEVIDSELSLPEFDLFASPAVQMEQTGKAKERLLSFFCLLYTSPSPRDATLSRMPSSA